MNRALPQFVDHLVFRVRDLQDAEQFYNVVLGGQPHQYSDSIMYQVGHTRLFFTGRLLGRADMTKNRLG